MRGRVGPIGIIVSHIVLRCLYHIFIYVEVINVILVYLSGRRRSTGSQGKKRKNWSEGTERFLRPVYQGKTKHSQWDVTPHTIDFLLVTRWARYQYRHWYNMPTDTSRHIHPLLCYFPMRIIKSSFALELHTVPDTSRHVRYDCFVGFNYGIFASGCFRVKLAIREGKGTEVQLENRWVLRWVKS